MHEDLQLMPRIILKAGRIFLADYAYYHYIIRDKSITNNSLYLEKRKKCIEEIMLEWYEMSQ